MSANKKLNKKGKSHTGAIIAGIAGVTAAAIGGYYLYGHENATQNRAKVRGWMLKAKGEVLEELEKGASVTESAYMKAIALVAKKYNEIKHIDADELESFIHDMRNQWDGIRNAQINTKTVKKTRG